MITNNNGGSSTQAARLAMLAYLGLVAIQVCIGILYKFSQQDGKYPFSQASSLCMSEGVKCTLSLLLFRRTLRERASDGSEAIARGPISARTLLRALGQEVPRPILIGIYVLAALYALNNNTVLFAFQHADPGTITLIKSASTFVTAGLLWLMLGKRTSLPQWTAILIQVMGLIIAQYDECKGQANYSIWLYLTIFSTMLLSTFNGAFNEYLIKSAPASTSLNAINTHLYLAGILCNFAFYLSQALRPGSTEPGFFYGYGGLGWMVVVSNSLIGVAITAVYKYADGIVKGLANSTSTAVLMGLSFLLAWTPFRPVSLAGCAIILMTNYIYFAHPAPPAPVGNAGNGYQVLISSNTATSSSTEATTLPRIWSWRGAWRSKPFRIALLLGTGLLVLRVGWSGPAQRGSSTPASTAAGQQITSPDLPSPRILRNVASGKHFRDVLLVADFREYSYEGDIDVFRAVYGKSFPHMVFFGPEIWRKAERCAEVLVNKGDYGPQKALYLAMKWYPNYAGYLLVGQRTFFNITTLATLDKRAVWAAKPECQDAPAPLEGDGCDSSWCQHDEAMPRCQAAITAIFNATMRIPNDGRKPARMPTHCYHTDAPFAYIPAARRDAYLLYAEHFMRQKSHFAVALPTMLAMLEDPAQPTHQLHVHFQGHGLQLEAMDALAPEGRVCGNKAAFSTLHAAYPVEWQGLGMQDALITRHLATLRTAGQ